MPQLLPDLLAQTGQIGFAWDIASDHLTWLGDVQAVLRVKSAPKRGADLKKLFNPQDLPAFMSELQGRVQLLEDSKSHQPLSTYIRLKANDGTTCHFRLEGKIALEGSENHPVVHGLLSDYSNAHSLRLRQDSNGDTLLETAGRDAMIERIDRARLTSLANTNAGFVLVLGLDRVRLLNTAYGANAVDALFAEIESRLRQNMGEALFVTRLSGDNFGILHPTLTISALAGFCSTLQQAFSHQPFKTLHGSINIGVTIGAAALHQPDCNHAHDVLAQAETALFDAKNKGRGGFVLSRPKSERQLEAQHLLGVSQKVLQAMAEGRMRLAFQPVVNLETAQPSFYECLIRMVEENGQIIPAAAFVPAMETLGLMRTLDVFSLRAAVTELTNYPDLRMSVNVSATSLTDEAWVRAAVECLSDAPHVAARLIVEVTESAAMHDMNKAAEILHSLKAMGCKVALDDFGAGQTSFRQLKHLGVSIVKIDRDYVRNMHDPVNRLFINTLFDLAKGLGIETVAEGAETLEDAGSLHGQGITHIQGYAYGQPSIHRLWIDDTAERAMLNLPAAQA